ncbi:MAG TPA: ABC transporter permease [Anaerolineales bacterium]|nr:ABC transporter permease [Anaerolineales bacterium]
MSKFWRIAFHEYTRHVFRRRFLLALFSVPLLIIFMVLLIIVVIMVSSDPTPIGYIDQSGLLANPIPQPAVKWPERNVPMRAYPDESSANADLKAGKLQAYYVISSDYLQSGKAKEVYLKPPKEMGVQQFDSFLAANLLASQPPEIANRIQGGSKITIESADKSRVASEDQIANMILPFIAGILFIVGMMTSSGYLMQAVTEEKENRTMEIMVTSVSPGQLMSGKVIADIAIGVTQLLVWALFVVLGLLIAKNFVPWLRGIQFSGEMIGTLALVMVPSFIMISGLMAAVGATVTEGSEGQQIMGLFTIPLWLPYILTASFINNPNSLLAVLLSLFPLTAPMTIAMRIGFTVVPTWQLITSVAILVLSAIGAVWLAGRAFRLGMLRYGQRVRWKEIFSHQGM